MSCVSQRLDSRHTIIHELASDDVDDLRTLARSSFSFGLYEIAASRPQWLLVAVHRVNQVHVRETFLQTAELIL
jgi:hypothetical protein